MTRLYDEIKKSGLESYIYNKKELEKTLETKAGGFLFRICFRRDKTDEEFFLPIKICGLGHQTCSAQSLNASMAIKQIKKELKLP